MGESYDVFPQQRKSKKDLRKKRRLRVYKKGGQFRTISVKT
jgi:hypothetical protein